MRRVLSGLHALLAGCPLGANARRREQFRNCRQETCDRKCMGRTMNTQYARGVRTVRMRVRWPLVVVVVLVVALQLGVGTSSSMSPSAGTKGPAGDTQPHQHRQLGLSEATELSPLYISEMDYHFITHGECFRSAEDPDKSYLLAMSVVDSGSDIEVPVSVWAYNHTSSTVDQISSTYPVPSGTMYLHPLSATYMGHQVLWGYSYVHGVRKVALYYWDGTDFVKFTNEITLGGGVWTWHHYEYDFNHDGIPDFTFACSYGGGQVGVITWDGSSTISIAWQLDFGLTTHSGSIGDIDNDGKPEIVALSWTDESVKIIDWTDNFDFSLLTSYDLAAHSMTTGGVDAVVGDVDNDGVSELFVSCTKSGTPWLYVFQYTGGELVNVDSYLLGTREFPDFSTVDICFFDQDSVPDILVGTNESFEILNWDKTTGFSCKYYYENPYAHHDPPPQYDEFNYYIIPANLDDDDQSEVAVSFATYSTETNA